MRQGSPGRGLSWGGAGGVDVEIYSTLMTQPLLQGKGLCRSFGEFQAIKSLDFNTYDEVLLSVYDQPSSLSVGRVYGMINSGFDQAWFPIRKMIDMRGGTTKRRSFHIHSKYSEFHQPHRFQSYINKGEHPH